MAEELDKIILKIFPEIPCLSPNRYTGFLWLKRSLERILKKDKKYKILDAGCGAGFYAQFLKEMGVKGGYLGVDLKFKKDVFSLRGSKDFSLRFKKTDLGKLRLTEKFDVILSLWVLEHLKNDLRTLKLLKKHLRKEGLLILAVPSIWTWPFEFGRHGFCYYSLNGIKRLVSMAGLKIVNFGRCGGPFGWFFVLLYDWLSLLVLIPVLGVYQLLGKLPKRKTKKDLGGAESSRKILNNSIFLYKKSKIGREIHYHLVKLISIADQKLPIMESSYFLVLKRKR